jgi:hypothetical protein
MPMTTIVLFLSTFSLILRHLHRLLGFPHPVQSIPSVPLFRVVFFQRPVSIPTEFHQMVNFSLFYARAPNSRYTLWSGIAAGYH